MSCLSRSAVPVWRPRLVVLFISLLLVGALTALAQAQTPTSFSHQGRLVRSGAPVNDTCSLTFTLSLDDFIITFFTTGPGATTLPIYVYGLLRRIVTPEVNALSTIWILVVLVVVAISQWFQNRQ